MKTRLEEVDDQLELVKWNATVGFRLWCEHDGKHMTPAEQSSEHDRRLDAYAQLRIEKAMIERGFCHG